jgi:hypothetical protein
MAAKLSYAEWKALKAAKPEDVNIDISPDASPEDRAALESIQSEAASNIPQGKLSYSEWKAQKSAPIEQPQPRGEIGYDYKQDLKNIGAGALSGAAQIGATILSPIDWAAKKAGIENEALFPTDRRAAIESGLREMGAQPESMAFKGGQLGAEIAGTAGAGGAIAKGLKFAPQLASAVESGGFKLAQPAGNALARLGARAAGGAVSGGAMTGMVNPEDTASGAALGAAFPIAVKGAGKLGSAIMQKATPEVAALAGKARQYGIDIPADRLVDSKTLNALSASLNYVPFSGRATTEEKMYSQINKAVSKTIGQDSSNITDALRKARVDLGSKFDDVLKNNTVNVDDVFLQDLVNHADIAEKELETGQAKIISNQIDEIINKAQDGVIDGQAAYNIKKTLDRIGKQSSPVAYYADELRKSLMGALNRSLPEEKALEFAKTRQQYGNMLTLDKLAPAGAEGEISMGRLANMRNVRDPQLRDLVDIAAQFGRTRESPHGAAQRVTLGALAPVAAAAGQLPAYLGAIGLAKGANMALSSDALRNAMLRQGGAGVQNKLLSSPVSRSAILQGSRAIQQ